MPTSPNNRIGSLSDSPLYPLIIMFNPMSHHEIKNWRKITHLRYPAKEMRIKNVALIGPANEKEAIKMGIISQLELGLLILSDL